MRTTTNFFLANLAVADLLVAIFCILQNANHIFGTPNGHWPFGELLCKLYVTILNCAPCTSIGILICVSLEKYIAVLHPLLSNRILTPQLRGMMALLTWSLAWLVNLPHLFSTKVLHFGEINACTRAWNFNIFFFSISTRTYMTASFLLWYIIPLITIAILYARIGRVLWYSTSPKQASIRLTNGLKKMNSVIVPETMESSLQEEKQDIQTTPPIPPNILVTPISNEDITGLCDQSDDGTIIDDNNNEARKKVWSDNTLCNSSYQALLQPLAYLLMFLSSSINPILYAFLSKRFRSAVSDIINCRTCIYEKKCPRTRTLLSEMPDSRLPSRSQSPTHSHHNGIKKLYSSTPPRLSSRRGTMSESLPNSTLCLINNPNENSVKQMENSLLSQYLNVHNNMDTKKARYINTNHHSTSHHSLYRNTRI